MQLCKVKKQVAIISKNLKQKMNLNSQIKLLIVSKNLNKGIRDSQNKYNIELFIRKIKSRLLPI